MSKLTDYRNELKLKNLESLNGGLAIFPPGVDLNNIGEFLETALTDVGVKSLFPAKQFEALLGVSGSGTAQTVRIRSLQLTDGPGGVQMLASLVCAKKWRVFQGVDVANPRIDILVQRDYASAVLSGVFEIENMNLMVEVDLPSLVLKASLLEGFPAVHSPDAIKVVGSLAKSFHPDFKPLDLPKPDSLTQDNELRLEDLRLLAFVRSKRVQIHCSIAGRIKIGPVELRLFQFDLTYHPGDGCGGAICGVFDIDLDDTNTLEIMLTAEHEANQTGWTFFGSTLTDFKVGALVDALVKKHQKNGAPPNIPDFIGTLEITLLSVMFKIEDKSKSLNFTIDTKFEIDGTDTDVRITLDHSGAAFKVTGVILIGEYEFHLNFAKTGSPEAASTALVGVFKHPGELKLQDLVGSLDREAKNLVPPLKFKLNDVLFACSKAGKDWTSVFGLALDIDLNLANLANLPLVGAKLGKGAAAGLKDVQVLFATNDLSENDANSLNQMLPSGVVPLPMATAVADSPAKTPATSPPHANGHAPAAPPALKKGFHFSAKLNLGDTHLPVTAGGTTPDTNANLTGSPTATDANSSPSAGAISTVAPPNGNAHWFSIQKALGPVYLEKAGVQYEKGDIWFLLSGDLTIAGLTISLDGLAVSTPLQKFDLHFHLAGLGIDYQKGPLEIGGMFLHAQVTGQQSYVEYDGIATLKTETLSLGAIGSYASVDGHPSMFIYVTLDYPLGGPPFFFVTGLAAGFGYNRSLIVPPVEQLRQFPLISEAVSSVTSGTAPKKPAAKAEGERDKKSSDQAQLTLTTEMDKMRAYIHPEIGEFWGAVGLRFTSFELLDTFALLTVAFGNHFELNILGLSSFATPAEDPAPLVRVELAIKVSFIPDEGFLGVKAVLTSNSYLFDHTCQLTGGMAFYSWFSGPNDGDFVLTVGGYHPKFKVPSHYPAVPRLGFNWQYSDQLSIKGGAYFALCGHAFMAGGMLDAVWDSGDLRAWFKAGADFLITWKPFHYEADIYIEIGASATIHFFGTHHQTISLGASVSIWGPKFAGKAKLHLWIISFSISFGPDHSIPPAISWDEFRKSFLPKDDKSIVGIAVKSGMVRTLKGQTLDDTGKLIESKDQVHWVLNARHFELITNSVIPINDWSQAPVDADPTKPPPQKCGVAPMDLRMEHFSSTHKVKVELEEGGNGNWQDVTTDKFRFVPVTRPVPAGLWGDIFQTPLNSDKRMVAGAVTGFSVVPAKSPTSGKTHEIERKALGADTELIKKAYSWQDEWNATGDGWVTLGPQWQSGVRHKVKVGASHKDERKALLEMFFSAKEVQQMEGTPTATDLLVKQTVA